MSGAEVEDCRLRITLLQVKLCRWFFPRHIHLPPSSRGCRNLCGQRRCKGKGAATHNAKIDFADNTSDRFTRTLAQLVINWRNRFALKTRGTGLRVKSGAPTS